MASLIEVIDNSIETYQVKIGDNTVAFMQSQAKLDDEGKDIVIEEAIKILSHCIPPGKNSSITNIAVGYVQSGKTLSFTTLTALAADNGYRIVIYLTGTKNNLQSQTAERLQVDLKVYENNTYNYINAGESKIDLKNDIKNTLKFTQEVLLIPILKHYQHISNLADVFSSPDIVPILKEYGAIIIDDEADQSSFNTYAKKNSSKSEWEEDDFSKTYSSILKLKGSLPSHSYIQYTATPQAAFLIDSNDILSPTYHTVLTPGKGYTGGRFFFRDTEMKLVTLIPEDEIYHHKRNPLSSIPKSLERALKEFVLSIAIIVFLQKRETFLSMMVHIDGRRDTNSLFHKWVATCKQHWIEILTGPEKDPGVRALQESFRAPYESIVKYINSPPSFEQVIDVLVKTMIKTKIHIVQSQDSSVIEQGISWQTAAGHILVGADMLNRGFTIEHLSMSYMPRTTKGKSNADTIEQRCRFFGYKMNYIDICRIYLSAKSLKEYEDYVDHEEILRANLSQCKSLADFSQHSQAMILADSLNPTRSNILSSNLIRNKLSGWRQMISTDCIDENRKVFPDFLNSLSGLFENCKDYEGNIKRNHRYTLVSIEKIIGFLKRVSYGDVPNITRRNVTIQYLLYLSNSLGINAVRLYEMAYLAQEKDELRSHKIIGLTNIQSGRARDGSYPGDTAFKDEDTVCFQIHRFRIDQPMNPMNNKEVYNLCVYYPPKLAASFVGIEEDDDE